MSLGHPGMIRTHDTIALHFWHSHLRSQCKELIGACDSCQCSKLNTHHYAELPPRDAPLAAWRQIAVDLIGPWTIKVDVAHQYQFRALTIIDTTTYFPEIIRIHNCSAAHVGQQFKNAWLSRYPQPLQCIYDQGTKFTGAHFQATLCRHGIQAKPTTVKNPQANAVVECLHQTITNSMLAALIASPPDTQQDINLIVDTDLQYTD
jgi:transposase InsO family protein